MRRGERPRGIKVSVVGPWTLTAGLERRNGEAMLGDHGAVRDLAASLAEGLAGHLAQVRRRVPGAVLVLQLDEPSLTAVLRGSVRTASGYRTHPAVDRAVVESTLRELLAVHDGPTVVHSCAPDVPLGLLRRAGADGISLDLSLLTERDDEAVGEAVEGGVTLYAGVVPATEPGSGALSDPAGSVGGVRSLWRRLGLSPGLLASPSWSPPPAGSREPRPRTRGRRSPTAPGRHEHSLTTLSDGRTYGGRRTGRDGPRQDAAGRDGSRGKAERPPKHLSRAVRKTRLRL